MLPRSQIHHSIILTKDRFDENVVPLHIARSGLFGPTPLLCFTHQFDVVLQIIHTARAVMSYFTP